MKSTIEWHERSLHNTLEHLRIQEITLSELSLSIGRTRKEVEVYSEQIKRAKEEKRDSFDRDKFNVKKEGKKHETI